MITLTERERTFTYEKVNELYQNWNQRSLEPALIKGILDKLQSVTLTLTQSEKGIVQWWLRDQAELYARLANPRLQFILQADRGVMKEQNHFFDGPLTYNLCQSVLAKIEAVGS